jgi:hypothetical protein
VSLRSAFLLACLVGQAAAQPDATQVSGDAVIRASANGSEIVITTTSRVAGAIDSLTWDGREFIDSHDHGRQMQSASNLDLGGGWGGSCFDFLKSNDMVALTGIVPGGASAGRTIDGRLTFRNVRAEMWWRLREALDPQSEHRIALPPDPELRTELASPKWLMTSGNAIQIEEKSKIKDRLGRSPDKGDAVVMSWWTGANKRRKSLQTSRTRSDLPTMANLGGRQLHNQRYRSADQVQKTTYRDEQG